MESLELVSLELDEYAERIGEYFEKELGMPIRRVRGQEKGTFYYKKSKVCEIVDKALGQGDRRKLVVYGNGRYHHFTYGLCKHADRFSDDYTYIHFDHHNDSYRLDSDSLSCGDFVPSIFVDTHASGVLFIGAQTEPNSLCFPGETSSRMTENNLREKGFIKNKGFKKFELRLKSLPSQVYLSFDLDVMDPFLVYTAYDQGTLTLEELMKCISLIKQSKDIIGADVLGYAGKNDENPGKEVYAEIVASLLQGA